MAFSTLDEQTNLVAVGWGQTSDGTYVFLYYTFEHKN